MHNKRVDEVRSGLGTLVVSLLFGCFILSPIVAYAQETSAESSQGTDDAAPSTTGQADPGTVADPQGEDVAELSKVTVTGSHIKQVDIEGPSPLLTIDRDVIEKSGATTVSELLRRLPISYGDTFSETYGQGFAPGSSGIALRGLGQNRTLVMLNGRRVAPYGFGQDISQSFVDLNSIPLAAVERVEVLKDGASATYGSDAIAGVVNIILRSDYEGSEVGLGYGQSSEGDGNETNLTAVTGTSGEKSSVTFSFDYFNRKGIGRGDRDFSESADHTDQGGEDFSSFAPPLANVLDLAGNFLAPPGTYDFNPYVSLVPDSERIGATLNFLYDIGENTSVFVDLLANRTQTDYEFAATPVFADFVVPAGQAFNTYGQDVLVLWRMDEWGQRKNEVTTDAYRVTAGLEGLAAGWDWTGAFNFSRSDTSQEGKNYVSLSALTDAVDNDEVNPFGTSANDPAAIAATKVGVSRDAVSELYGVDAKASAELWQLDAGPVALAVGAEWRHESLEDKPDSASEAGDVVGQGGTSTEGDRDVGAAFVEFNIPIVSDFELQLAGRYENYSDFGDTLKPKVGLRYQPIRSVLLRASWGQGFRAPSLQELYLGQTVSFEPIQDAVTCAAFGAPPDCVVPTPVALEGNEELDAEKSESFNIGALFEPLRDFTIQIDYWNYHISDAISQDPQYVVDNEGSFPGRVIRDPDFGNAIVAIDNSFFNIAEVKTDGLDLDIRYLWDTANAGAFSIRAIATYLTSFERKAFDGEPWEDLVGEYRYPKWRNITSFGWAGGNHGVVVAANYTDSYKDSVNPDLKVDSWLTFDAQYDYSGWRESVLSFGIKNITDEDPPFANEEEGYDYATHNPLGRFYYARLRYAF